MNKRGKKVFLVGVALLAVFVLWTVLVLCVDVKPVGQQGTDVGFAALNVAFHKLTGERMGLYSGERLRRDGIELTWRDGCSPLKVVRMIPEAKAKSAWTRGYKIVE